MNKKPIRLIRILIVFLMLFLTSCGSTDNWQIIEIEEYGTMEVPETWNLSIVDGYTYFSSDESGDSEYVLVQYRSGVDINKSFAEVEDLVWLQDEIFSNSTGIIKYKVQYKNGSSEEMFALYLTSPDLSESTEFFCLDKSISEDTLKKIAKSYNMYE